MVHLEADDMFEQSICSTVAKSESFEIYEQGTMKICACGILMWLRIL